MFILYILYHRSVLKVL